MPYKDIEKQRARGRRQQTAATAKRRQQALELAYLERELGQPRICCACGTPKPIEAFADDTRRLDGKSMCCLECKAEAKLESGRRGTQRWRERHPEEAQAAKALYNTTHLEENRAAGRVYYGLHREARIAASMQWAKDNPEAKRASDKRYYDTHKEARAAYADGYREEHRETLRLYAQNYRDQNPEKVRQALARYYTEHAEEIRAYTSAWLKAHPEKARMYFAKRQARKKALPDTFTQEQYAFMMQYWHFSCAICGNQDGFEWRLALDHWIPLASPDCPGTVASNILPLCHGRGGCNTRKRHKDGATWLKTRYSPRKAQHILKTIQDYFAMVIAHQDTCTS